MATKSKILPGGVSEDNVVMWSDPASGVTATSMPRRATDGRMVDYTGYGSGKTREELVSGVSGGGSGGASGGGGGGASAGGGFAKPSWDFFNATKKALKPQPLTDLEKRANDFLNSALGVTESWLKGQLTDDTTRAVRQATSEASMSLGLGSGSAARNLTIRDLGIASVDLQQKGLQFGSSISDQIEKTREFNRTYDLEVQKVLANARQLDLSEYQIRNELSLRADELTLRETLGFAEIGAANYGRELDYNLNLIRTGVDAITSGYPDIGAATFEERI